MPAKNNRTITLTDEERSALAPLLWSEYEFCDGIINRNIFHIINNIPDHSFDLVICDPPYNITKTFGTDTFHRHTDADYLEYLDSWMPLVCSKLKATGSMYVCCDWRSSAAVYEALSKHLTIINRITWQRDKGRGASKNWKNGMEDIYFAVADPKNYYFDLDSVKQRRRVVAPYQHEDGTPKDWEETVDGRFRITCPSNFWDDITVPFWSMPENTEHPTQKPEKLYAKLILASCPQDGIIFDPFAGACTTAAVAKKLNRHFICVEQETDYCLLGQKRLALAETDATIQGYEDGIFYERNTKVHKK